MAPGVAHREWAKNEEIVIEFFIKTLQVILESRIPNFSVQEQGDGISSPSFSSSISVLKARQKWFNLVLNACPIASELAEPWRADISQPLVIDVLLLQPKHMEGNVASGVPREMASMRSRSTKHEHLQDALIGEETTDKILTKRNSTEKIVLERWTIWYNDQGNYDMPDCTAKKLVVHAPMCSGMKTTAVRLGRLQTAGKNKMKGEHMPAINPPMSILDLPNVYKKSVIFFRSLYCIVRALPAHHLFRLVNSSSEACKFSLGFQVSRASLSLLQAEKLAMTPKSFVPVELLRGKIHLSMAYRCVAALSALEVNYPVQLKIISDYVGSPTTDHIRRFPGYSQTGSSHTIGLSGRKFHVASLLSGVSDSSPLRNFQCPHSCSEGKFQTASQTPSNDTALSFPVGDFLTNIQNLKEQHSHPLSTVQLSQGPCSAPVRTQVQVLPDREISLRHTRGLLPPLSTHRSMEPSSQHTLKSGLQIRQMGPSFKRNTSGCAANLNAVEFTLLNFSPNTFPIHQVTIDERIDEKLPFHVNVVPVQASSRTASKSGSEKHLEEELDLPFALHINEKNEFCGRNEAFGFPQPLHPSVCTSFESQAAAAGVLVRILKSATPLRASAKVSEISTSQGKNSSCLPVQKGLARVPAISGGLGSEKFSTSGSNTLLTHKVKYSQVEGKNRKTMCDALEEFRGYQELKEFLEMQSGQNTQ